MSKVAVQIAGQEYEIEIRQERAGDASFIALVDGEEIPVYVPQVDETAYFDWMVIGRHPYELTFEPNLAWVTAYSGRHALEVRDLEATGARPVSADGRVKAPIPGLITRILVEAGQQVEAGQALLVLEAMKMENEIRAPRQGTVLQLSAQPGKTVALGEMLVEIG